MPDASLSSFACATFFNGLAGSIGYFSFPFMSRYGMASLLTAFSLIAIVSYMAMVLVVKHQEDLKFGTLRSRPTTKFDL